MYKKIIIILVTILFIGVLFYVFKKSATITNYPSQGKSIVAFGDSLVFGLGATEGNDFSSLLEKLIGEKIINMGISGNTSAQGLARVEEIRKENPKVVIVLLGGNDFLQKVSKEETFKNINEIVLKIQDMGAMVILVGIKGGLLSDKYEEYFEDISEDRGTLYVSNILGGLIGNVKYMSDAVHPNDAGYKKIAEKIHPLLKKSLE